MNSPKARRPADPARRDRPLEAGVVTLEAVLVMPLVLIPVLFAVFTFGRLAHTRIVLDAAAAAGARVAAAAGAATPAVGIRIATELRDGGIDPTRVTVSITPASAAWGEPIRVRVSASESAGIPFLGSWSVPMTSEFVTRSEVTH